MKKFILTLVISTLTSCLNAQEQNDKISIKFADINKKTAIQNIEKSSNYKFYYDPEWIKNDTVLISGNYKDISIQIILDKVFEKSNLNYYISSKSIILTKNSIIYDELPENYFNKIATTDDTEILKKPVFKQQYDSLLNSQKGPSISLIGKEIKKTDKKLYTLSGYIKNSKNTAPISNISVKVQGKDISTVSNKEGYYELNLPSGINNIEIESFNFNKKIKKIVVYSDGNLDFEITENITNLDEIIINTKAKENINSVISGLTTIDIEAIKNIPLILGERDIFKVAITLPGIKTTGEGSAGFNVRGGKDDQNLILLDNAVLYNPSHFLGFFSAVNPFTTRKANIYKGSIPAEFGGRLSSVFDITSKNGNLEKTSGEGGVGPVMSNIAVGTPIVKGKSSILIGGRATYSGWILRSLNEESLKSSEASFYDGIIKYNDKLNKNNDLESTIYYSHDAFSITSDSLYKYSNRLVSLKWDHAINKKNNSSLILTNSQYKFNIDYNSDNLNAFDFGYKINETQFMLKLNYLMSKKHKINYGVSSKLYNINPGFLTPKKQESILTPINIEREKGLESAIYISDNFKINDKLLIDIGLRYSFYVSLGEATKRIYEKDSPKNDATVIEIKKFSNNETIKTYGGFEPRIALRYHLSDDLSVKASYDNTYQYIHLLSSNTTQSPTDTWKLSDLNVKPQLAHQYSLGFYQNLDSDNLELSLEGYYKKSKNILDYKVGAELLLNENIETELLQGEGKAYGIELLLKKQSGRLNGWIGYTYSRTFIKLNSQFNDEKVNDGNYFPTNFDKPHDISTVLNYKFTKRYSFSTNLVYQTGRPITYPIGKYYYGNAEYTLYSDRNKFRIPDYYRLDIGFNIEGNHKIKKLAHSFWNISIYNVLGRNNPYSVYFITDDGQVKAYKTSIFSIPIPTITYNFKF